MRWHVPPLLALVPLALLVAAPVPKPVAKKLQEVYGEIADSGCQCELTKEGALQIVVPKGGRAVELTHDSRTPPLTTKTVTGDFELTVRVSHQPPKDADRAEGARQQATVSAGVALYAEGDPKTNATFVHKHSRNGDKWTSGLAMQSNHSNGSSGSGRASANLEDKPLFLRLTRRGDTLTSETSTDGKKWTRFSNHKSAQLGETVVIGPVAFHNTTADYEAVFDQYELKPLKEEKK